MQIKCVISFIRNPLSMIILFVVLLGNMCWAQAKPTLATNGPRAKLKVGKNIVKSVVYNEQKSFPSPLKRAIQLPVYLIVTNDEGNETRYETRSKTSKFIGGNPPERVQVSWANVDIPKAGSYILTVEVPQSRNPIAYNLSRRSAKVSKPFKVGQGGNGNHSQAAAGYNLTVKLDQKRGTRGAGYWVYLKTPEGRTLDKKRSTGSAQVVFKKVAPLKYFVEVKAGVRTVAKEDYRMPREDASFLIDLN